MNRQTPLARTTPMPRSRPVVTSAEAHARDVVRARSSGVCEAGCGRRAEDWAHRVARSQGGPWKPSNGLHLCRACHTWCHANPEAARAAGLILPSGERPTDRPVWLHPATAWAAWWLLTDDGIYVAVDTDHRPPAAYPNKRGARPVRIPIDYPHPNRVPPMRVDTDLLANREGDTTALDNARALAGEEQPA